MPCLHVCHSCALSGYPWPACLPLGALLACRPLRLLCDNLVGVTLLGRALDQAGF